MILYLTKAMFLALVLVSLQACGTTVHPGQRGVHWNPLTGGLTTQTLKSGFYWRVPWSQIYLYNVQWRSYTETIEALSSDHLPVILKTVIVMRPIPDEVYFLAQDIGSEFYPRVAKPELLAAIRSAVSHYPMVTVLEHGSEIVSRVEAVVTEKLKGRHLQVASIAMADIELAKVVLDDVERKQAKEREKEPKQFELLMAERIEFVQECEARTSSSLPLTSEGSLTCVQ